MFECYELFTDAASSIDDSEIRAFFLEYFHEDNLPYYDLRDGNEDEKMAIRVLFASEDVPLEQRIEEAFHYDAYNKEAVYISHRLADDEEAYYALKAYYDGSGAYASLSAYQQSELLEILNFYLQYMTDIHSIRPSLAILKRIILIKGRMAEADIGRFAFLYSMIEDSEGFYALYQENRFTNALPYLLLIEVLLKNEENAKAHEVLNDMLKRIPYSDYVDHIWDLENVNNEEARRFVFAFDTCYDELCSVPDFFSWCRHNKEYSLLS